MDFMMMVLWFQRAGSGVICVRVPVRSSSSGQYESSPDIKRYLVSALGNINHTLFSSFSLMPPQSCGQLWTVARETRARLLAANESDAGWVMPVHLVTETTAGTGRVQTGLGGREQRNHSGHCFIAAASSDQGQTGGVWKHSAETPSYVD